jgi:polyribonucleotide nucleotidyltransferase
MDLERKTTSVTIDGKEITFETGKIARQAGGAVIVRSGDTMVFSTACMSPEPMEGIDFFPLKVDYQEKFSAAGKTLAGFIKREGRPTQRETLVSRLIDRPLRPMFEEGLYNEVQVLSYVWSYDGINSPEPLAITACSAALAISDIPLIKPVAGVRVGFVQGKFVVNPTTKEQAASSLDLLLAGTEDAVLMIEGFCDFLTEEQVIEALEVGHAAIKKIWPKENPGSDTESS